MSGGFSNSMVVATYVGFAIVVAGVVGIGYTLARVTAPAPSEQVEKAPSRLACEHNLLFSESKNGDQKQILDENGHGIPCKTGP